MLENYTLPNGDKVTFEPEGHIYTVNGIEVPSITALIQKKYGNIYSAVNEEVLKRSAEYGTAVHKQLEELITQRFSDPNTVTTGYCQEVENYFTFIEPIYDIHPVSVEKIVVLHNEKGVPVAAGRFDMICNVHDITTIADFKTTSSIHKQQVTAQLNLYLKASIQSGYLKDKEQYNLGVIHLSGFTSKFIPIPVLADNFYLQFIE